MKKYISVFALLMLLLTGCGSSKEVPAAATNAVCYAIANTANSKGLNLGSPLVQDTALETIANYGYVCVVNIDGQPDILMAESYDIPEQYKQASRDKLMTDARTNTAALVAGLQNVIADDPEVDYLEGLRLAARSLAPLEGYDNKTIIVLGTGLSSAGTLNFHNNLLSAEPETIIDMLEERREIPDFTGITVVWQQMGDVAAPQQALTQAQRKKLQQLWSGIVERGHGTFVYNDIIPIASDTARAYPEVSVVELPTDTPIRFEPEEIIQAENILESPLMLTEEQVTFIGDSAAYLHPEEAVDKITPIAEILMQNKEVKVLLVGTTAGDNTNEYTLHLSQDRAATVRDTLIELGIARDRITAVGMGSSDPWHISGVGTDSPLASANRKVVLLDASSQSAREILEKF